MIQESLKQFKEFLKVLCGFKFVVAHNAEGTEYYLEERK